MSVLILLRGLPGAGKSTLATILSENKWPVFSVDSYFTDPVTNKYDFQFEKNHLAYKQCQDNTEQAMSSAIEKIFIDNTFTLEWEMEPYFKLASKYTYQVFVVTVENRHKSKNTHNISEEQLKKMAEKYKVILL
ncbi:AAA family ATPase [Aurantibacillus circumpalustris]|uniref:AAA family ATPase n=1 Tax=Aurantibacillus circumpalustris TaxID=3036359 RepID=UPI00295B02A1|nr:AAA family ATPase [Aurantibacillus circumpalustris]